MNMQVSPPAHSDMPAHETVASAHPLRRFLIGGMAIVLVLGGYYYWSHAGGGPARRPIASAPVRVASVIQRDMPVVEHTIGTVVANSNVSVTARVQGLLTKAYFKEGDLVKAGDLLFEIDPEPYQVAYNGAVAALATAKVKADRYEVPGRPERHCAADQRRCPGGLSSGQVQHGYGAAQSRIYQNPLAGGRQDRPHHAAAGQSGFGQRHYRAARHHHPDSAHQSVVQSAPVGPAAHPGARASMAA